MNVLVAELHFARSHALTFSTRHTAGHGVADDGVLAVVESQLLDDDVRVVLEHGSGSVECGQVLLGCTASEMLSVTLREASATTGVGELECLLDCQRRVVLVSLSDVRDELWQTSEQLVGRCAVVRDLALNCDVLLVWKSAT
ncbi:hypothetical protein Pcac1_g28819 [Phytophthora cactorum]|nr:hypothetical protein Pcac1_g28819 [Phytophthora cactorum]